MKWDQVGQVGHGISTALRLGRITVLCSNILINLTYVFRLQWCQRRSLSQMSEMASQSQTEYKKFRQDALSIFEAAVASVCPKQMMTAALKVSENGNTEYSPFITGLNM